MTKAMRDALQVGGARRELGQVMTHRAAAARQQKPQQHRLERVDPCVEAGQPRDIGEGDREQRYQAEKVVNVRLPAMRSTCTASSRRTTRRTKSNSSEYDFFIRVRKHAGARLSHRRAGFAHVRGRGLQGV